MYIYARVYIHIYVYKCDFHCVILYIYNPGNPKVHEAYMTGASSQGR